MEFEGEFSVSTSPEETWKFLLDHEKLGSCIPNCQEVSKIDEDNFAATIGIEISYISATFDTHVGITEREEPSYLEGNVRGEAEESDSRMEATGELEMKPRDDGGTDCEYTVTVDITGRVMNMGSRVVKRVSQRQTKKTINNIQNELGAVEG